MQFKFALIVLAGAALSVARSHTRMNKEDVEAVWEAVRTCEEKRTDEMRKVVEAAENGFVPARDMDEEAQELFASAPSAHHRAPQEEADTAVEEADVSALLETQSVHRDLVPLLHALSITNDKELGRGGNGKVFSADISMREGAKASDRLVALKLDFSGTLQGVAVKHSAFNSKSKANDAARRECNIPQLVATNAPSMSVNGEALGPTRASHAVHCYGYVAVQQQGAIHLYTVFEKLQGGDFSGLLKKGKVRLSLRDHFAVAVGMFAALAELRDQGILHYDLKPGACGPRARARAHMC